MRKHRFIIVLPLLLSLGSLLVQSTGASTSGRIVRAAPAQQAPSCEWKPIGNFNRNVAYAASAIDSTNGVMYVYGGYTDPSANYQTQSAISTITFGAKLTAADTQVGTLSVAGAPDREALAGVYRPKGDDSAVYWIAGRNNNGDTSDTVYEYKIKTKSWTRLATTGNFGTRDEHVAAYDPKHDVIWVVAGETKACTSVPCQPPTMPTNYLAFDPTTGAASWHEGPAGGLNRSKGAMGVYDSGKERLIVFGGTPNGSKGTGDVWALDLSDPDLSKAKWTELKPTGSGPAIAVGAAAYDAERRWMVVAGGMKTDYAVNGKETAETRTFALDLSVDPPAWRNLGTSVGDRIQPVMEYVPQHKAVVLTAGREALNDPVQQNFTKRTMHALVCTSTDPVPPTATRAAAPTRTPGPGGEPTSVVPTPTLMTEPMICDNIKSRVPNAVLNDAATAPDKIAGYKQPCNPNLPPGVNNPLRHYLGLRNPAAAYHPLFNGVIWRCGCQ